MTQITTLTMAQQCSARLQLTNPSTFFANTDQNMILLKAMFDESAQEIRNEFPWPELVKIYTFTLATGTASYALPGDYDRRLSETIWNRTQKFPLFGPIDGVQWEVLKSGLITSIPRQRFRLMGWTNTQVFIDPTPSSGENGQVCAYEYIIKTLWQPKVWVASTSWLGLTYCSYNGNIYTRGGTGAATTGTTAPTHTSGSVSDGLISWTYVSDAIETIQSDADLPILNAQRIMDRAVWRFKQERGLDYEALREMAEQQKDLEKTKLLGAGVVTLQAATPQSFMIGVWNYPDGSY